MPREIEANALTDVEVEFISLVPNAASRLPFRLTKNERGRLARDFAELQEAFMKQEAAGTGTKLRAKRKDREKDGTRAASADGTAADADRDGREEEIAREPADGQDATTDIDAETAPDSDAGIESQSDTAVMTRLEEGLASLAGSLETLAKVIADFEARLAATEVQVRKTERRLAGTVAGTPVGDPETPVALAKSVGEPPLMDTGMGFHA